MALTALGLFAMLMLVIGACRRRIQLARIGDSGNRRGWRPDGTLEWWALALADVGYLLVGVGAPAAALAGLAPLRFADHLLVHATGIAVAVVGIGLTLQAQLGLGPRGGSGLMRPNAPSWSPAARSRLCATRSSPHCCSP